jgi:hypothetical protein
MIKSPFLLDDLKHSGPHVWPVQSDWIMADIFIVGRPELAYLTARRKALDRLSEDGFAEVKPIRTCVDDRIHRTTAKGKRVLSYNRLGSFIHRIQDDPNRDVRHWLKSLRHLLCRVLPRDPTPDRTATLRMLMDRDHLSTYSHVWL